MDSLTALIPLLLVLAIYGWLIVRFRAKKGKETPRHDGITPFGVHGWLAFFIFVSYYVAPIFGFCQLVGTLENTERQYPMLLSLPGYNSYKVGCFSILVATCLWQIWVANRLRWKHEPQSLRNAKILCFAGPWLVSGADVLLSYTTMSIGPTADTFGGLIKGVVASGVWGLYFVRSKRCANTYWPAEKRHEEKPIEDLKGHLADRQVKEPQQGSTTGRKPSLQPQGKVNPPTDEHYGIAAAEVDGAQHKRDVWERLFVESKGDVNTTKALYIAERAKELAASAQPPN